MARQTSFTVGVINITVHPHSPEKYVSLFRDAFTENPPQPFPYRGNELVAVKVLSSKDDKDFKYIQGIIYKFTQIRDKDWYDAQKGIPLENEEDKPNIDIKRIFPNLTVTYFCFIPQGHRFFIITKYKDFNISILYFAKTLKKLLNRGYLIEKYGDVNVSIETDKKSIEEILQMDTLSRLTIRISLPNDDDVSYLEQEIVNRLKRQNSIKIDEILVAGKGKSIIPDGITKGFMNLALSNGYIIAKGIENDTHITKKSLDNPIQYNDKYDTKHESLWNKLLDLARSRLPFFKSRQKNDDDANK